MPNITIGQLDSASTLSSTAVIPVFEDGTTYKIQRNYLIDAIDTELQTTSTISGLTNVKQIASTVSNLKAQGSPASTQFTENATDPASTLSYGDTFSVVSRITNENKDLTPYTKEFTLPSTSEFQDVITSAIENIQVADSSHTGLMSSVAYNDLYTNTVNSLTNSTLSNAAEWQFGGSIDLLTNLSKDGTNLNSTFTPLKLPSADNFATKDVATTTSNGLMSSTDKKTLNNLNTLSSSVLKIKQVWTQTFRATTSYTISGKSIKSFQANQLKRTPSSSSSLWSYISNSKYLPISADISFGGSDNTTAAGLVAKHINVTDVDVATAKALTIYNTESGAFSATTGSFQLRVTFLVLV